ncbi:MAG: MarR family transcriptional regulator [Kofleriaceae bacterium]
MTCSNRRVELPRSTLELLFRVARVVNERAIARVNAEGIPLRQAHTQLFPHITTEGVRLTVLAERLGISKQAVGQLVDDLEAQRVVERVADPADARAKLIRWTQRGHEQLRHGIAVLMTLEAELARAVGKRRLAELATTLQAILAATDQLG